MKPPTIDEVQAYIDDTNVDLDAKVLWNHYEMKGWKTKVGPITRWHSCVGLWAASGWGKTSASYHRYKKRNARPDDQQRAREQYEEYLSRLTPRALKDKIADPGAMKHVVWLMEEILNAKKNSRQAEE